MNTYQDSMIVKKYASHLEQDKLIAPGPMNFNKNEELTKATHAFP